MTSTIIDFTIPLLTGDAFLRTLAASFPMEWTAIKQVPSTVHEWNPWMNRALEASAQSLGHVNCSASRTDRTTGVRSDWRHREYLYDMTWFRTDEAGAAPHGVCGDWDLPTLILEHENGWAEHHFLYDFWKLLFGYAPLRVMIGYGRDRAVADSRLSMINDLVAKNRVLFPAGIEDIVLVGFNGMRPRGFRVFRRGGGPECRTFNDCGDLEQFS